MSSPQPTPSTTTRRYQLFIDGNSSMPNRERRSRRRIRPPPRCAFMRFSFSYSLNSPCQIVLAKTLPTPFDNGIWCLARGLLEYIQNQDPILINTINNPPILVLITHSQLVTASADVRQRARLRKRKRLALLQAPEQ